MRQLKPRVLEATIAHVPIKKRLHELLDEGRIDQVVELAAQKKRVLGGLISQTYDPDPRIGWRAIEAMGPAAARVAETNLDYVREHLRRLYWLVLEESGGICWRAPEAMAEVVSHLSDEFPEYVPVVMHFINEFAEEDLGHFRPGTLWAIGRLSPLAAASDIEEVLPAVVASLDVDDPQARGLAVLCLEQLGRTELLKDRDDLLSDNGPVDVYENGEVRRKTVGGLVRRVLGR